MGRKKAPAGKARSNAVSVRVQPKTKFALELAAQIQDRSITGVIEWAMKRALADWVPPAPVFNQSRLAGSEAFQSIVDSVWSVDEVDCFLNLAETLPSALTYEQAAKWALICASPILWEGPQGKKKLVRDNVKEAWSVIEAQWERRTSQSPIDCITEKEMFPF